MNERSKTILAVYGSGLLQGICLILFPAAGPLLANPRFHNLSSSQFGLLFTPQIVAAIVTSALAARLASRFGMKRVLFVGLTADLLAMTFLAASHLFLGSSLPFTLLLLATGAVGAGFGLTVTALNAFAFDLFPNRADAAVTALHVLTGLGQVGAALILSLFLGLGFWWGAPATVGAAVFLMLLFLPGLALQLAIERNGTQITKSSKSVPPAPTRVRLLIPFRIWLFAAVVFLYGICEATFGNWSAIYLEQDAGLAMTQAGLALSIFWGMVTAGRALFALTAL